MALLEDTEGFTELALGPQNQSDPGAPRHGLYVEFYMNPVLDKAKTLAEGRSIHEELIYIMIMVPGDKGSIVRRPVRTGQDPKHDNNRFHNEYVAFLQNRDNPAEGTMLEDWRELSPAQVMDLQHLGIKTIEHVADLNDTACQKFMGLADLKTKAKKYLARTSKGASVKQMEAIISQRDNEIETLKQAVQEQGNAIAELRKGN